MNFWNVYIGTYADEEEAGIHFLQIDKQTGQIMRQNEFVGIANPSFLKVNTERTVLYAISEVDEGEVVAYSINQETGDLTEINRQKTNGSAPCYVSLHEEFNRLFVANYGGTVSMFPINENGTIGDLSASVSHSGNGQRSDRQDGPHPHSIMTDSARRVQFVADLGTDSIHVYDNTKDEAFVELHRFNGIEGAGPRLFAFHQNLPIVYCLNELNSTISVYSIESTYSLQLLQTIKTLPKEFSSENTAAHIQIAPSEDYVYASNRGHDSIVTYKISDAGLLENSGVVSSMGKGPRSFAITPDGKRLIVANERSNSIVIMDVNGPVPNPNGNSLEIKRPVCVEIV